MFRIMVMGDSGSISAGITDVAQTSARQIEDGLNALVHNFSYGGATVADLHTDGVGILPGMFRQVAAVRQLQLIFGLDMVVVAVGSNDWGFGVPLLHFKNSYTELLDGLLPFVPHAIPRVVCMTPPWRFEETGTNLNGETLDAFRDVIVALATERGIPIIRAEHAIPKDRRYYFDDAHPNEEGHRLLAQSLVPQLRALLNLKPADRQAEPQRYFWRYNVLAKVWKTLRFRW